MTFPAPDIRTRAADARPVLPVRQPIVSYLTPQWGNQALTVVGHDAVLGLPGANYCVGLISRAVATVAEPVIYDGAGNELPTPLVIKRPVAGQGTFNTYSEITKALIMYGNFVAVPVGDQLLPLPPSQTYIHVDEHGRLRFDCGSMSFSKDEVLHIAINTTAGGGGIGHGVLNQFMRSFGAQLDQQSFVAGTWKSNGVPPSILHIDVDELTQAQAEEASDAWLDARDGRSIAVLSKKMTLETVAWNPEAMELLESRKFSIAELGLIFGIHPGILSASLGDSMTYENSMAMKSSFVHESVGPYLQVIEEALSDLLPDDQYAMFEVEKYLRMTVTERDAHYTAAIAGGWMTSADVRQIEGLPAAGVTA